MREVRLNWLSPIGDDTILKFRLSSPAGGWFPVLQELHWFITNSNVHYAHLCLSPHLKRVSIYLSWSWANSNALHDLLPAVASTISALPTSALQSMSLDLENNRDVPRAYFEDTFSPAVLRCGPSLTKFIFPAPLSDLAMNHLIRLPHLRILRIGCPPPTYSAPSLPLVFPSLTEFTLGKGVASGWLSLFKRLEHPISTTQGLTSLSKVKESLESLRVEDLPTPIIDSSFTSPIRMFHNLVTLHLGAHCHDKGSEGKCAFKLNNVDVTNLAMALPRLKSLFFGYPCRDNTCPTTVACLLHISVYCVELKALSIHFSTGDVVGDFKSISEDPQFRELRSLPRCTLAGFGVGEIPLDLDEFGVETVVKGMVDIFPSLQSCQGYGGTWVEVSRRIKERTRNVVGECYLSLPFHLIHSWTGVHN